MTARSTHDGSRFFSSLRETRLDGETSSSATRENEDGEKVWSEEGWEDGRMIVSDSEWNARGTNEEGAGSDAEESKTMFNTDKNRGE